MFYDRFLQSKPYFQFVITISHFKSWLQCFSMQAVLNKCFVLNPEKIVADLSYYFREKANMTLFNSEKNDVTKTKATKLGYSNNQFNC